MARRGFVAMVAAVLWAVAAVPAGSAPAPTHCRFASEVSLTPGLSIVPSSGTFSSGGETGTVECDGVVRGLRPTGPGTLGVDGEYGTADPDTCLAGEGEGRFSFTFPTADGPGKRSNVFSFSFGLIGGPGAFEGKGFSGSFEVRPVEGNCFVTPVTRISIRGEGTITD